MDTLSAYLPVGLIFITSMVMLVSQRARISIVALAIQYLAVFWLITQVWPVSLAAVKLVAGWMAVIVLSTSQPSGKLVDENLGTIYGRIFRALTALIVWIVIFSLEPVLKQVLPLDSSILLGALGLLGMGLVQLGVSTRPLRVIIGLLTFLSGFEIVYAAVEGSLLVAGLLAAVTAGISLAGAYLLTLSHPQEDE